MGTEQPAPILRAGKKVTFSGPVERDRHGFIANKSAEEKHVLALVKAQYCRMLQNIPGAGEDSARLLKRYESSIREEIFRMSMWRTIEMLVNFHRIAEAYRVAKIAGKGWSEVLDREISRAAAQQISLEESDEKKAHEKKRGVEEALQRHTESHRRRKNFWRSLVGLPPVPIQGS